MAVSDRLRASIQASLSAGPGRREAEVGFKDRIVLGEL